MSNLRFILDSDMSFYSSTNKKIHILYNINESLYAPNSLMVINNITTELLHKFKEVY
jgi:hypothetical protein